MNQPRALVTGDVGPSESKQKGVVGKPREQEKVFVLTHQQAKETPDVTMGKVSVYNVHAFALLVLGATHYFVSIIFLAKLNRMLQPLSEALVV